MFRLSKISHHQVEDLRTDVTPDTLAGKDPANTIT